MSVDLSVSSKHTKADCMEIVNLFLEHKLVGKISPNLSILPSGCLENGCTIRLPRLYGQDDKSKLCETWNKLKSIDTFGCAHLQIAGKFDGCVTDYLRDSKCSQFI